MFLVLVRKVLAAQQKTDIVAVEMVVWFDVVNCPVLVLVRKVACGELIQAYLGDLTGESTTGLEAQEAVEPLSASVVGASLHDAGDHEPDVVG